MCGTQDKNARDLVMHLHAWQKMLLEWYEANMAGHEVGFLPEGFTWKTTPELNKEFWQSYQDVPLEAAVGMLEDSHERVMAIVEKHTDEELFTKGHYKWTGTTSLGQYIVSATSSHYEWAAKLLKKM